jgi:hypothetical protein
VPKIFLKATSFFGSKNLDNIFFPKPENSLGFI